MRGDLEGNFGKKNEKMETDETEELAKELLQKLVEDFLSEEFTLEDVADSYEAFVAEGVDGSVVNKFGKQHLDWLVQEGALDFDEDEQEYSVNSISDLVKEKL